MGKILDKLSAISRTIVKITIALVLIGRIWQSCEKPDGPILYEGTSGAKMITQLSDLDQEDWVVIGYSGFKLLKKEFDADAWYQLYDKNKKSYQELSRRQRFYDNLLEFSETKLKELEPLVKKIELDGENEHVIHKAVESYIIRSIETRRMTIDEAIHTTRDIFTMMSGKIDGIQSLVPYKVSVAKWNGLQKPVIKISGQLGDGPYAPLEWLHKALSAPKPNAALYKFFDTEDDYEVLAAFFFQHKSVIEGNVSKYGGDLFESMKAEWNRLDGKIKTVRIGAIDARDFCKPSRTF